MAHQKKKFPLTHILGFILSLAMTFGAVWVGFETNLSFTAIMWIVGGLAVLQAIMQLFMFMHMTEGKDGNIQTINIAYGAFVAIVVVVGTVWTMGFGNHEYHGDMDMESDHSGHEQGTNGHEEMTEEHSNH